MMKAILPAWLLTVLAIMAAACSPLPTSSTGLPTPFNSPAVATQTTGSPPILESPTSTPTPTATATGVFRTALPDPTGYQWIPIAAGLNEPVDIQNAADGSGRLFIVEKIGEILIMQNGQVLDTPFLDIRDRVDRRGVEQGLLGLAFHPGYAANGEFFVDYIDRNGNTAVARFHVSADDPNQADPSSEADILHVAQPYANHNGGRLVFGPDGYLYTGVGDGGSEGDPQRTGQNLDTLLGKILRIDVDHGNPYAIPSDNPFANGGGSPEIWASGLRNPWRFSFDPGTGDLYIGDVGQDAWEEVDFVPAGSLGGVNFGWSFFEGNHPYNDVTPAGVIFTFPVTEYSHDYGCSITGGSVYRGTRYPEWAGIYFYGDYCSGTVWGLIRTAQDTWITQALFSTGAKITTFGVDEAGELYLTDYGSGSVLKFSRP